MTSTDIPTIVIGALGIVVVLYVVSAWGLARLWCKPKRTLPSKTPADFDLPAEAIQFYSHGVPLKGWFIPAVSQTSPQPVIAMIHGWGKNSTEMLLLARLLHKADFALLLYDVRGHGMSGEDGPITIFKFAEDIIAAIEYLDTRTDIDKSRMGVLGRSLGGSGAIVAASMDARIRAVVSCSAFADPRALTRDFLAMMHIPTRLFLGPVARFTERWLGTSMENIAPKNRIGQLTIPLLLIHGETDHYIQATNMDVLYARSRQEYTERLLIPKRGHSDVIRDAKCGQETVAFFHRNLMGDDCPITLDAPQATPEWEQVEAK